MLIIIQIIALLQGFFVLFLLYDNRKDFRKTTLWLLFGSLLSVVLYVLGDDKNNLFIQDTDWFPFDNTLFVTFLFLFFRYYTNGKEHFSKLDYFFFIPNLLYFILEAIEIIIKKENTIIEILEITTELVFIVYLSVILYSIISAKKKFWVINFVIPIVILFVISFLNDILKIIGIPKWPIFRDENFNTYLVLIVAFLFYFISFKCLAIETKFYNNRNK